MFEDENPISKFNIGDYLITESENSPAEIYGGDWERKPEGLALWTASSGAGETIAAGLPNIVGSTNISAHYTTDMNINKSTGCIYSSGSALLSPLSNRGEQSNGQNVLNINASRSNSIYGNSETVQPPAIKVYVWKRVN